MKTKESYFSKESALAEIIIEVSVKTGLKVDIPQDKEIHTMCYDFLNDLNKLIDKRDREEAENGSNN